MTGLSYLCESVSAAVQLEMRKGFALMTAMSPMGISGSCSLLVLYFCISLNEGTSSVSSWQRQHTRCQPSDHSKHAAYYDAESWGDLKMSWQICI